MSRNNKIIKVSIVGILTNVLLVIFKATIGLIANSISVILDAVNNLSDVFSSVVTIIGAKLSGKKPDKKHPYGYGRIEYFSSVIIAIVILLAGLVSLKESIEKIINPVQANYSIISLIIILTGVFVKFFLGKWVKNKGQILNSGSLIASGTDAIGDSLISFSTFIGALASFFWGISLEGYLGLLISIFIIKAAWEILTETIDEIIGVRVDSELTKKLKEAIKRDNKDILGVYDLVLHNYGPDHFIATAHIQVDDDLTAKKIHRITRSIQKRIYTEYGIALTIGIYAANGDGISTNIKKYLNSILKDYSTILQTHGFYVDEKNKEVSFDIVIDFEEKEPKKIVEELVKKLKSRYKNYTFNIVVDADFCD